MWIAALVVQQSGWAEWWFPGLSVFAEMVAFVWWWGLAIVVAAIPILFIWLVLALIFA